MISKPHVRNLLKTKPLQSTLFGRLSVDGTPAPETACGSWEPSETLRASRSLYQRVLQPPHQAVGAFGGDFEAAIITRTPLGRIGYPEAIARVAVFLASDESGWLTGEVLLASGGLR